MIWLRKLDQGVTEVWIGTAGKDGKEYMPLDTCPTRLLIFP